MPVAISENEFAQLRDFIEEQCGIALEASKMYLVESRLTQLLLDMGCANYGELLKAVRPAIGVPNRAVVEKIVDAMTTNETYWFRDSSPYETLTDVLYPMFDEWLSSGKKQKIRLWSAACSTGQEPYSMAMLVHEFVRTTGKRRLLDNVVIIASDISPSVLMMAKAGRYNGISMSRGLDAGFRQRYFTEQGTVSVVNPEIKNMVTFKRFNLQDSFAAVGSYDLIFLRNVAIYFSRAFKKELYGKVARSLNQGGYFFLGSSEILMEGQEYFNRQSHGRCTYYQVKDVLP